MISLIVDFSCSRICFVDSCVEMCLVVLLCIYSGWTFSWWSPVLIMWSSLSLSVSVCVCVCVCVMVTEQLRLVLEKWRLGRRGALRAECPGVKSLRWAVRCSAVWFLVGEGGWWRCWWIYHSRPAAPGICSSQAHFLSSGGLHWNIDVSKWTDPEKLLGFIPLSNIFYV